MKPPPPIEELLPHRYGMLMVERVVAWDPASATVSATPSAQGWYAEAGGMPSRIGIELTCAAIAWSKGVLLGARAYRATRPYFAVGSELIVKATRAFSDETGMGAYDCIIEHAAKARILVFEPPDFEAFIAAQKQ